MPTKSPCKSPPKSAFDTEHECHPNFVGTDSPQESPSKEVFSIISRGYSKIGLSSDPTFLSQSTLAAIMLPAKLRGIPADKFGTELQPIVPIRISVFPSPSTSARSNFISPHSPFWVPVAVMGEPSTSLNLPASTRLSLSMRQYRRTWSSQSRMT